MEGRIANLTLYAVGDDGGSGPNWSIMDEVRRCGRIGGGEPSIQAHSGTMGLMLAVLEDGIRAYLSENKRTRDEAEFWMSSNRDNWPFSFTSICRTLALEPSAVRRALLRMREQNLSARSAIGRNRPNVRPSGRVAPKKGRARPADRAWTPVMAATPYERSVHIALRRRPRLEK